MRVLIYILWGLLALAVARTTILIRRRDTSEFSTVDGSAALAVLIVVLLLAVIMIMPHTKRVLAQIRGSSPVALLLYFAIAVFSGLWSELASFTLFRAGEVLTVFLAALIVMSVYDNLLTAERALLRFLMLVAMLSFLQRAVNVGLSIEALHTNVYTVPAGMGLLYCIGERFDSEPARRRMLTRWAVGFFLLLAIGTSVGSNIGTFVGLMVILMLMGMGRTIVLPAMAMASILVVLLGAGEGLLTSTIFSGRSVEELSNLTGRSYLWTGYLNGFLDRPLLGYGFAVGARVGHLFGVHATTNTHNGFLEAVLGLGILGTVVFLYYCVALARELLFARSVRVPGALGCVGALTMVMVNNNSKSIIGGAFDPAFVGIVIMLGFFHFCVLQNARYRQSQLRRSRPQDTLDPEAEISAPQSQVRS